jgi:hypothetical protein
MIPAMRRVKSLAVSELYYDCWDEFNLFHDAVVVHAEVAAIFGKQERFLAEFTLTFVERF